VSVPSDNYKIYCINLEKEKLRKERVTKLLSKDGLLSRSFFFKAICKDDIDEDFMRSNGFEVFPDLYYEPLKRPWFLRGVNVGEIGCATSHYFCWKNFLDSDADYAVFMEDDNFWDETGELKREIENFIEFAEKDKTIDMVYFGRTRPDHWEDVREEEEYSDNYLLADYSYNTHCYMLTRRGAEKIINQNPMKSIMPLDELLCSMFMDDHPHPHINKQFEANLKVLAIKNFDKYKDDDKYLGFCFQTMDEGMSKTDISDSDVYES